MKNLTLIFILLPMFTLANQGCRLWQESDSTAELVIGEITLSVDNIFDLSKKEENKKFHRYANKWHMNTKEKTINRELLFEEGDKYDARLIKETERLIRAKAFIKEVDIYPVEICGNRVNVNVDTKDNWTLTPGISFGRTGGKSKYSFELQERNLFGQGKSLELKYRKDIDRVQRSIKYSDDNLFASRNHLDVIYENNSDGKLRFINLYRPFFSLDVEYSWGIEFLDHDLVNSLYERGEINDEIGQNRQLYSARFGKLVKRTKKVVHRYNIGLTADESRFFNSDKFPHTILPDFRSYQYPWISYEYFGENYIERTNFNSMGRQEDISLGHRFNAKIGKSFSDSSIHYDFSYAKGFYDDGNNLILLDTYFNGIYQTRSLLNSRLGGNLKWFHFQSHNKTFFSSVLIEKASNLFLENRQYLGSDTGLRGYPFRYLQGKNKFLITLEQRYFYNWYPLKTFQFASALFIDSGAAWDDSIDSNHVTNIGFGFRFVPTRTSSSKAIHVDLTMPLDERSDVGNWQIQLRTRKSF
ncbi:MAG: hypothetical protein JKY19_10995 [Alcanivoracaceae bacterium]|nr:hypothetical protein [Alcanivoracaceae bacterium]